jgi:molecular chaperone HscB
MNYFQLFGIPLSLQIDANALQKKYYQLSKEFHPDRVARLDHQAQEDALQKTAEINQAKRVLENVYTRIEYILSENKQFHPDQKPDVSPSFLMEMMEINEQCMEMEMENNIDQLPSVQKLFQQKQQQVEATIEPFLQEEVLDLNSNVLKSLNDYYFQKKYLLRIQEKLVQFETN